VKKKCNNSFATAAASLKMRENSCFTSAAEEAVHSDCLIFTQPTSYLQFSAVI
jgi:hypothetical protein